MSFPSLEPDLARGGGWRGPRFPPPVLAEVHVWTAAVPHHDPSALVQLLGDDERLRARRFVRDADRDRYVAAHALVRSVLAGYLRMHPTYLRFGAGRYGKPFLATANEGLRFSLTHAGDIVACAVAPDRVGIDVEAVSELRDWQSIARRFFTPAERSTLQAAAEPDARRLFFKMWTCKEAVLKAIGTGLSEGVETVVIERRESGWSVAAGPGTSAWTIAELPLPDPHVGCVCWSGGPRHVRHLVWPRGAGAYSPHPTRGEPSAGQAKDVTA